MSENYFMGLDGFVWFTGVVEDRNDPDKLGRVRVRCLGFHTEDLVDIPTADLPWATVMHPVTDPSMQGLGNSHSFLVEGSWVIGFFSDSIQKQQPIIMGTLPGYPDAVANPKKGFNDPNGKYPSSSLGHSRHGIKESDVSRLARGADSETHSSLLKRRLRKLESVPLATKPNLGTVSDVLTTAQTREDWAELDPKSVTSSETPYTSATYPFNHVFESESGHIFEIDDTPDGERLLREHKSGTFEEVHPDGSKVVKVIGDDYEIVAGNKKIYINATGKAEGLDLTVRGNVRQYVTGDYILEVGGDFIRKIHGNERVKIGASPGGGNLEEEIRGNHAFNISNNVKGRIGEDVDVTTEGNEQRINNGTFKLVAKSNILAATTGGTLTLNASGNVSIDTTSGIMSIKSGTTLNMKSATAMTIGSETTFTGTSTGIGTFTFSGDGSNFIANNGSSVAIGLTTHTHTQGADSDGDTQATTNVPNA